MKTGIDALLSTQVNGAEAIGGGADDDALTAPRKEYPGLGPGAIDVGVQVSKSKTRCNGLYAVLTTGAPLEDIGGLCSATIDALHAGIATAGSQHGTMNNRYRMLNLNETYHAASDMQAVTAGGSALPLLSRIL